MSTPRAASTARAASGRPSAIDPGAERRGQRRRRRATAYIELDTSRCEACWKCLDACRESVLGKVDVLWHHHAKLRAAEACTGCGRCVKVCETGALSRRQPEDGEGRQTLG